MASPNLELPPGILEGFCRHWRVTELALFGSALRDGFGPQSDLDILVTSDPEANWSLLDHLRMEQELADLLGREIDLATRRSVERSHNPTRRH